MGYMTGQFMCCLQLTIEGATALKPHALRLLWSVAPGEVASVAELFDFANAITRAYAQAGYFATTR